MSSKQDKQEKTEIEEFKKSMLDEIDAKLRSLRNAIVSQIKYIKAAELAADQPRITVKVPYERREGFVTTLEVSLPLPHNLVESEILDRVDQLHAKLTHKAQIAEDALKAYVQEVSGSQATPEAAGSEKTVNQKVIIKNLPADWPYCPECGIPLKASKPSEKYPQYGNWWKCGEHKLTASERKIAMNMAGRKNSKPTDAEVKLSWEVLG